MSARTARSLIPFLVACLFVSGCSPGEESHGDAAESTTRPTASSPAESKEPSAPREATYRIGLTESFTTDNPWAIPDVENSAWNIVVQPADPLLYAFDGPTHAFRPLLAATPDPPDPMPDGDRWTVTVPLRSDVWWSDGEMVDAHDFVFTFETVRRLGLAGLYYHHWPVASEDDETTPEDEFGAGLVDVEAANASTLRLLFNVEPGLAMWPFAVGTAPVFAEHYWSKLVAGTTEAADLYALSGLGAPHAGGFIITDVEPSAFWRNEAVASFWDAGSHYVFFSNGSLEYTPRSSDTTITVGGEPNGDVVADFTLGPFVSDVEYSIYTNMPAAILALQRGDVDYVWAPIGLERGLVQTVLGDPRLDIAVNPTNGFRYLAFNLRRFPMSEPEFRRSIACRIDKTFMAEQVLSGSAIPLDSLVPPGYGFWYNPEVPTPCAGMSQRERFEEAARILEAAGWTWDIEPAWDEENRDVLPAGAGLRSPDGRTVQELELLSPGPGYDPLRATYTLFIEEWATELGIPVRAETTSFQTIVSQVFSESADFDMYILGWGVTPVPDHVFDFFASDRDSTLGGFNTPGYSNPALDELAREFRTTRDLLDAASSSGRPRRSWPTTFRTSSCSPHRSSRPIGATSSTRSPTPSEGSPGSSVSRTASESVESARSIDIPDHRTRLGVSIPGETSERGQIQRTRRRRGRRRNRRGTDLPVRTPLPRNRLPIDASPR